MIQKLTISIMRRRARQLLKVFDRRSSTRWQFYFFFRRKSIVLARSKLERERVNWEAPYVPQCLYTTKSWLFLKDLIIEELSRPILKGLGGRRKNERKPTDHDTRCHGKEDSRVDFSSISMIKSRKSSQLGIFHNRIALLHVTSSIFSQYNMIISPRLAVDV